MRKPWKSHPRSHEVHMAHHDCLNVKVSFPILGGRCRGLRPPQLVFMTLDLHFISTLSYISELYKFVKNTLVKFLDMSKRGVQSSKLLGNSNWLLDSPPPGFSMAFLSAMNSPNVKPIFRISLIFTYKHMKTCGA